MREITAFLIVIWIFSFTALKAQEGPEEVSKQKLESALDVIYRMYVNQLNDEALVEDAINGMLKELDPHSYYISAEKVEELNEPLKGSFEGIGIRFNILNDTIIVVNPIPGGPSEVLGIRAGDKIVAIEGESVAGVGITNDGVRDRLLGEEGSSVDLTIYRYGSNELLDFEISRDKIPIHSVDAAYMLTPEIGYIKINRFSATTVKEFREHLQTLKDQGMTNMVLDLRGNTGGYLLAAFELADEFLSKGKMIVYYEGEHSPKRELKASARGGFEEGKLVVLIDEGSASASEIVSGAIQDWDRGLVIGRRSYGKGLVQREFELPDGAAIRLTVARYYTPTGRSIQKPYDEGRESYRNEIQERYESGELTDAGQIELHDSLKFLTPNGRVVYGGGGISPDIFIPIDTVARTDFYRKTLNEGLLNDFTIWYVDRKRGEMKGRYPDLAAFRKDFNRDELVSDLVDYLSTRGYTPSPDEVAVTESFLRLQLTAMIGRNLFNEAAYYEIINEQSRYILKATEVIEKDSFREMKVQSFD